MELIIHRPSLNAMFELLAYMPSDEFMPLCDLVGDTKYSHSAMEQAAANLMKYKLITAKRGPGGGYKLNRPLSEIKMKEFVRFAKKHQPVLRRSLELLSDTSLEEFVKPFVNR